MSRHITQMRVVLALCLFAAVAAAERVLVLGSGGFIGTTLTAELRYQGHEVLEVKNRRHIDLRRPNALDVFTPQNVTFCFFLACEVGGSKFLTASHHQREIVEHNAQIYTVVFEWLARTRTPFVFTSSYLQHQATAYGTVKRFGEAWLETLQMPNAIAASADQAFIQRGRFGWSARLWNVYGSERIGERSHVLADWVEQCLTANHNLIHSRTDGHEYRQFVHVVDLARGLIMMMKHRRLLEPVTDLSSGRWYSMRHVAQTLMDVAPVKCNITYSDVVAVSRDRVDPNLATQFHRLWHATRSLPEGIKEMFMEHRRRRIIRDEL